MIRPVQKDLYAVIGFPAAHSLSPVMMNRAFRETGVAAVYLALESDDFPGALEVLGRIGFRGLSVTLPHKEEALRLCDDVDETALAIGAVNTLKRHEDRWLGCNTDWLGAVRALRSATPLEGQTVSVVGAGGAARAVVYGLVREGARVTVFNRTLARAQRLAERFACMFAPFEDLPRHEAQILVQCTSLGLGAQPRDETVPPECLRPNMVVMDIVYRPLWTPLLKRAARLGCRVVTGLDMLLYQGVAQFSWWLDREAPEQAMRSSLMEALKNETRE